MHHRIDIEALRARGVSPTMRGKITNPVRRLLWPFIAPYFAALLERMAANPHQVDARPQDHFGNGNARELNLYLDALRKDLGAIAHRLASIENGTPAPIAPSALPMQPPPGDPARRSYAQCGEDLIVEYVLRRAGAPLAIRYLDIGAAFPAGDNNTFLFYEQGGTGVLVEADPDYVPAYRVVRPRDAVESAAVVPSAQKPAAGTIDLLLAENRGWTSVLPDRMAEAERRGKGGLRERITVPAVTIGEILERHFAGQDLHLLSLDVEGLDDAVLRDIDFSRHRPWIIVMETMGDTGPDAFLLDQGYAHYADTYVNRIFVQRDILERVEH